MAPHRTWCVLRQPDRGSACPSSRDFGSGCRGLRAERETFLDAMRLGGLGCGVGRAASRNAELDADALPESQDARRVWGHRSTLLRQSSGRSLAFTADESAAVPATEPLAGWLAGWHRVCLLLGNRTRPANGVRSVWRCPPTRCGTL